MHKWIAIRTNTSWNCYLLWLALLKTDKYFEACHPLEYSWLAKFVFLYLKDVLRLWKGLLNYAMCATVEGQPMILHIDIWFLTSLRDLWVSYYWNHNHFLQMLSTQPRPTSCFVLLYAKPLQLCLSVSNTSKYQLDQPNLIPSSTVKAKCQ